MKLKQLFESTRQMTPEEFHAWSVNCIYKSTPSFRLHDFADEAMEAWNDGFETLKLNFHGKLQPSLILPPTRTTELSISEPSSLECIKNIKVDWLDLKTGTMKDLSELKDLKKYSAADFRLSITDCEDLKSLVGIKHLEPFRFLVVHGKTSLDESVFKDLPSTKILRFYGPGIKIKDISGIHKYIPETVDITVPDSAETGFLDLLRAPKLKTIDMPLNNDEAVKALKIIKKYLGTGKPGIVKAQQELIENDLEDFA